MFLQIVSEPVKKGAAAQDGMSLVEVGPRICLQPIKIFAGSFGGPVLYENPAYVSPNKVGLFLAPPRQLLHVLASSEQLWQELVASAGPQQLVRIVAWHQPLLKRLVWWRHVCMSVRRYEQQSRSRMLANMPPKSRRAARGSSMWQHTLPRAMSLLESSGIHEPGHWWPAVLRHLSGA